MATGLRRQAQSARVSPWLGRARSNIPALPASADYVVSTSAAVPMHLSRVDMKDASRRTLLRIDNHVGCGPFCLHPQYITRHNLATAPDAANATRDRTLNHSGGRRDPALLSNAHRHSGLGSRHLPHTPARTTMPTAREHPDPNYYSRRDPSHPLYGSASLDPTHHAGHHDRYFTPEAARAYAEAHAQGQGQPAPANQGVQAANGGAANGGQAGDNTGA